MDMTKETVNEQASTDDTTVSLAETHKQWKINAASVLHDLADGKNLCSVFDHTMAEVGLPARPDVLADVYRNNDVLLRPDQVTGEETTEAFDQWKRDAT